METEMNPKVDRTGWPRGEWDDEPDIARWTDEATGFACEARRNRMGAWCGYVIVPAGHPWHGDKYVDADVHGGVTLCNEWEPGGSWYVGFDCAHIWDKTPHEVSRYGREITAWYKPLDYVREQCAKLAAQARDASSRSGAHE